MKRISVDSSAAGIEDLLKQLDAEGDVLLEVDGHVAARLTKVGTDQPKRVAGTAKGKIWISDDFDEPLEDFAPYM